MEAWEELLTRLVTLNEEKNVFKVKSSSKSEEWYEVDLVHYLRSDQRRDMITKLRQMGWTQKKVAEAIGVAQSTVSETTSNIEIDNTCIPDQRRKIPEEEDKCNCVGFSFRGHCKHLKLAKEFSERTGVSQKVGTGSYQR